MPQVNPEQGPVPERPSSREVERARQTLQAELLGIIQELKPDVRAWAEKQAFALRIVAEPSGFNEIKIGVFCRTNREDLYGDFSDSVSEFDIEISNRYDGVYFEFLTFRLAEGSGEETFYQDPVVMYQHESFEA